jgi:hypothetical protein
MYCTYLSTLRYKRLSEKNEPDHGGAACCASSNMAFAIETKPSPPHVCDGLVKGSNKLVNQLRKK